jgi:hypothetical protein
MLLITYMIYINKYKTTNADLLIFVCCVLDEMKNHQRLICMYTMKKKQ